MAASELGSESLDTLEEDEMIYFPTSSGLTVNDFKLNKKDNNCNNNNNESLGKCVDVNGHELAIFYWQNHIYCIDEKCPHAGGPLHLGDIEDIGRHPCIICPWHKFIFRLDDGHIVHPRGRVEHLHTYPVKVDHHSGLIVVGFKSFSPSFFKDNDKF